ncbi:S-layer homology domain-containing protein [Sporosarcina sp. USHLN248]|uniref:S-layer homology domain-containing protein n=1 Tax=Sporosarcina sp. USHLN248 TaxID=3081300 RepID=UPI003017E902
MNKIKTAVILVLFFTILGSPLSAFADRLFIDVDENNPYYPEIKYLYDLGIVDTQFSGYYGINNEAERKDVIVMLGKALGLDGTQRNTSFKDVPSSYYASGYIQSAVDAGIVSGYSDGTFRPTAKLNRGHLSAFIERAFHASLPDGSHIEFKDVGPTHTAYKAVGKMAAANITVGYPDGTFKPEINLSKKHLTTFMYRTMQYIESGKTGNESPGKTEANKVYSKAELARYLNEKYSIVQTKLMDVKFNITITENDSKLSPYDYYVELGFNSVEFENRMNAHLSSIKNAGTAEEDVALSRKQLKDFLEKMALDIIEKAPQKKILGQNYNSGYRYDALKLGRNYQANYSWTNYEAIQMKTQWPGDQPEDYWLVMSALRDPSDPKVIQYDNDERSRRSYIAEYATLKHEDFQITGFGWRSYLDKAYYDPKYYY